MFSSNGAESGKTSIKFTKVRIEKSRYTDTTDSSSSSDDEPVMSEVSEQVDSLTDDFNSIALCNNGSLFAATVGDASLVEGAKRKEINMIKENHASPSYIATTIQQLEADLKRGKRVCLNVEYQSAGGVPYYVILYCNRNLELETLDGFKAMPEHANSQTRASIDCTINGIQVNDNKFNKSLYDCITTDNAKIYYNELLSLKKAYPNLLSLQFTQAAVDTSKEEYQVDPTAPSYYSHPMVPFGRDAAMTSVIIESARREVEHPQTHKKVDKYECIYSPSYLQSEAWDKFAERHQHVSFAHAVAEECDLLDTLDYKIAEKEKDIKLDLLRKYGAYPSSHG